MLAKIQMRRGTSAEWAAAAPVILSAGEPGYDTTEKKMKVGDGSTEWANLDFLGASDCPYEVGDILTTENPTHPAERWPGTIWATYAPGRTLVGLDANDTDFNTIGKEGGQKSRSFDLSNGYAKIVGSGSGLFRKTKSSGTTLTFDSVAPLNANEYSQTNNGGGATELGGTTGAASILMPHKVVYHWIRTGTAA